MSDKLTLLHPAKATYFWWYLLGIVLVPFLGLGLILLYVKHKELRSTVYKISDHEIEAITPVYSEKTDLASITDASVSQRWIDKQFSIGTIQLQTHSKTTELRGIKNPQQIADIILQAAEAERLLIREKQKTKAAKEEPEAAGSIDRLEYLTGLWQQGLITNEEFKRERKNMGV
ncbi:MAG TPA: PH domain-containing protein [Balneolaceae bacterium]|nr:PH domain-containing protein [Balneolaceae bacterium]